MATYDDMIEILEEQSFLQNRVSIAVSLRAVEVLSDTAHADYLVRRALAYRVFCNPRSEGKKFLIAIICKAHLDNPLLTKSQISQAGEASIKSYVDQVFDDLAKESANV